MPWTWARYAPHVASPKGIELITPGRSCQLVQLTPLRRMVFLAAFTWSRMLTLIVVIAPTLAFGCGLSVHRPRRPYFSALLLLLGLDAIAELTAYSISRQGLHNTVFYNVFVVLEFLLVLRMLAILRRGGQWPFIITALLGLLGWCWSWSRWKSLDFLLTEGVSVASLLICLWALVLLWQFSEESDVPLSKKPEFWVLTAMLVFYGALFPIIGPLRLLYEDSPQLAYYLYTIVQILSVARYGLIGYGCILEARAGRPLSA